MDQSENEKPAFGLSRRDMGVAAAIAALGALLSENILFADRASAAGLYLEWPFSPSTLGSMQSGALFGDRSWTRYPSPHNGIDFGIAKHTPVYACGDGKITISRDMGVDDGRGRYVQIAHAEGIRTGYAHLETLEFAGGGAWVSRGQRIGTVGGTWGYDPHLHWELWNGNRVDPVAFMNSRGFHNVVGEGPSNEENDMTEDQAQMLTEIHRELVSGGKFQSPGYGKADIQYLKERVAQLERNQLELAYSMDGLAVPTGVNQNSAPYWRGLGKMIRNWLNTNPNA